MILLPKDIYRFNAITIKLPMVFFIELELNILKCTCKPKRTQMDKANLRKKKDLKRMHTYTYMSQKKLTEHCKSTIIKINLKKIELEHQVPRLQAILQNDSHQNSMVLVKKEI